MNCHHARELLSAWIDGELPSTERTAIEQHVSDCPDCRTEAEHARNLHSELFRAFEAPRQIAAQAAEQTLAALPAVVVPEQGRSMRWRPNWISVGLAMALGFLLALLIFPPWKQQRAAPFIAELPHDQLPIPSPTREPVARLVVATGTEGLEVNGRDGWQRVADLPRFQCPSEGSVRTNDKLRCELVTSEGCVVRMNSGTEIQFRSPGCVELKRGEIWCRSTSQAPLEVLPALSGAVVEQSTPPTPPSLFSCMAIDASCLLSVEKTGEKVRVTAAAGSVAVKAPNENVNLKAAESATITRDRIVRDRSSDRLLAASWMQPLLVQKGHADRELGERVDDLLARVGESKLSDLYESEIRSLGEYGVLPLLRYVESPRSDSNRGRRLAAMRIISDLAPAWLIGDLIGLLGHSDAEVRFWSATALQRLTQQTQGVPIAIWRDEPAKTKAAIAEWQTWWARNRDRYPMRIDASSLASPASQPIR